MSSATFSKIIYDAIIVGARCAGSPTAMLLARKGYRVLVVDRATFPSDTISTHLIQPPAVERLARWGLLERLIATGCPPIHTYSFDFGPFALEGTPGTSAFPAAYCPRRIILDKLLLDAAAEAGAEIREGVSVEEILTEDGRVVGVRGNGLANETILEKARVVIGADGRGSIVAKSVQAEPYQERPPLLAAYYTYWSGIPMNGRFETYIRPYRGFAAAPTHAGLTMTIGGWPLREFEAHKHDIEGNFLKLFELAPEFAERIRHAKREAPFSGMPTPNLFRKPYGPGWLLVGDAGYLKDPITAQGINDAFRDAERCVSALDQYFTGIQSYEGAMGEYQRERDEHAMPMYDFTCQLASLEPPPPEIQKLFQSIHGQPSAMDRFVQMNAGTIAPAEFFAEHRLPMAES